jgi:hypothetical protein
MEEKADVVRGWLRKAASDVVTLEAALGTGSLDGTCFQASNRKTPLFCGGWDRLL